jgi:hypothetical protein
MNHPRELIPPVFFQALEVVTERLQGSRLIWAITGSVGFALHGLPVTPNDLDIQSDAGGVYEIERRLSEFVVEPVRLSSTDRIRSHFGKLQIGDVRVELMGDVEKRLPDGCWEGPPDLWVHVEFINYQGLRLPILSLEYEQQAYAKLGRADKARQLAEWLRAGSPSSDPRRSGSGR